MTDRGGHHFKVYAAVLRAGTLRIAWRRLGRIEIAKRQWPSFQRLPRKLVEVACEPVGKWGVGSSDVHFWIERTRQSVEVRRDCLSDLAIQANRYRGEK